MRHAQNERGIALVLAIFALVVIGGLVAGAFFVGSQEQTVGKNTVKLQQAAGAAEGGAQAVVSNWTAGGYNAMAVSGSTTVSQTWLSDNSGWYRGSVKKLSDMIFLVTSEGFSKDSTARQKVGALVRLRPIEVNINSALKTQGATKIGGSSFLDGNDHTPTGWTGCSSTKPALPGVRITDPTQITYSGGDSTTYISGNPRVQQDTTINSTSLTTFGDVTFTDLRNLANKVLTNPGTVKIQPDGVASCNTSTTTNWGDPLNPAGVCGNYFPIIYVDGDISVNGVEGQGVLIVSGDLSVQGGFEFYGPVIVKGSLKTTGTGGHFNGGVIAANVELEQNTVLGNAVINYSSCALIKSLTSSAAGGVMQERSWVNLN